MNRNTRKILREHENAKFVCPFCGGRTTKFGMTRATSKSARKQKRKCADCGASSIEGKRYNVIVVSQ